MLVLPALLTAATNPLLLLLLPHIHAHPTPTVLPLQLRAAEPTNAWISVDKTGQPTTITPVVVTASAATTTISAIPPDLTATVLTRTAYGELTTSTGTAPAQPTAQNESGEGYFLACGGGVLGEEEEAEVEEEEFAPFCEPRRGSALYLGTTYYVTWNPSAVNATKVSITGTYLNATTGKAGNEAFTSDAIKAKWSYYAWTPKTSYLSRGTGQAVNITLTLNALSADNNDDNIIITQTYPGPTVLVTKAPTYQQPAPSMPSGAALYIALPTVLGLSVVMIFGVCLWNRKTRTIGLGNVMSRSRHRYGVAKSRAKRMTMRVKSAGGGGAWRKRQAVNFHMMETLPEDQVYRDEPPAGQLYHGKRGNQYARDAEEVNMVGGGGRGHMRRDREGLGNLAETPTSGHFPRQQGGNVFREEVERQQRQR